MIIFDENSLSQDYSKTEPFLQNIRKLTEGACRKCEKGLPRLFRDNKNLSEDFGMGVLSTQQSSEIAIIFLAGNVKTHLKQTYRK